MKTIRIEKNENIVIMRLEKGRGNAIDEPLVEDLTHACREIASDGTVRGVLLASAHPKLFCPGLDLIGLLEYDRVSMERFLGKFAEAVWALYALEKPVVAALSGHAVAGGCVLALTADWRVLRRGGVNIGLNEVKLGVPLPWSVAALLRASIRPEMICEVALLGRNFSDEEAFAIGLVHELAPADGFEGACLVRLAEFAEKDPEAFAITKRYLRVMTLEAMKEREGGVAKEVLERWFSETTRARIRATAESLGKPRT